MEVIFASGVLEEVAESARFYEAEVEGLGRTFFYKLGEAIEDIKKRPTLYRVVDKDYRRHLLDQLFRFICNARSCHFIRNPYGVIYRVETETIYVLAVMHLKRKPGYWKIREE